MTSLKMNVSESAKFIYERRKHIEISKKGIEKCVDEIEKRLFRGQITLENLYIKNELHPKGMESEEAIHWIFFADLLNFSFWTDEEPSYKVSYKGQVYSGYFSLIAAINRTLGSGIPLTSPEFFGSLSKEELNNYLMGDNSVACPMIAERVNILREASQVLLSKFDGSFKYCLKLANNSALKLLDIILTNFESFNDSAVFENHRVYLLKRAQILVADIWAFFEGKGFGEFDDIETLTMFPDYRVPQSLQYFGVLQYSQELTDILKAKKILENGSGMEVEIRGCSIHAVNLIWDKFKESPNFSKYPWMNCIIIDYFLWGFRREKAKEMEEFPMHRTRSIYY